MTTKWLTKAREIPWWGWPVLAGYVAVLGLDLMALKLSGQADWRQHLRFSDMAHALTGLEIFVSLPLLRLAMRRHRAITSTRPASDTDAVVDPDG